MKVSDLDKRILKWIHRQGWKQLRSIQDKALSPVSSASCDVVISASTAAGKTEAFFLPALNKIVDHQGISIIHICPLKALINDQARRLAPLCDLLDIPFAPWHGDVRQSIKNKMIRQGKGVLFITPESLEAMLIHRSHWLKKYASNLTYIGIDEFHAFIGNERGAHLLSLLDRLEYTLGRCKKPIPRIALSATLGEIDMVPGYLRASSSLPNKVLVDTSSNKPIKLLLQGFTYQSDVIKQTNDDIDKALCYAVYAHCFDGSHLVFANNRQRAENMSATLASLCKFNGRTNKYFPHHGSLSREIREDLEHQLQNERSATVAICTNTLELGIDIGQVDSVVNIATPPSVSSLRQRLGRSGRRDSPAVLRLLMNDAVIDNESHLVVHLRLQLLQTIATVHLMLIDRWYEPVDDRQFHFSTLVQQILATLSQFGSMQAISLYHLLCHQSVFKNVTQQMFSVLLRHLGKLDVICQLSSGALAIGAQGERITSRFEFYAVFNTPSEFTVTTEDGTCLGNVPVESMLCAGNELTLAGSYWQIKSIDHSLR